MDSRRDLNAISTACIHAARLIEEDGSPVLRKAMRVVLFILGREIAERAVQREGEEGHAKNGPTRSDDGLPH